MDAMMIGGQRESFKCLIFLGDERLEIRAAFVPSLLQGHVRSGLWRGAGDGS